MAPSRGTLAVAGGVPYAEVHPSITGSTWEIRCVPRPLLGRPSPAGSEKVGNFPKLPDVYMSIRFLRPLSQGGPRLAAAIGPPVPTCATPRVFGPPRAERLEDRDRAVPNTRTKPWIATHGTVIYATLFDIQSRQGTFDSPTRWTYWRVQSVGSPRHVPHALEGRKVPR